MTDYGLDLSCTDDLDPKCSTVTGGRLVAEACYRRLITPRGGLIGDPNYGTDITGYVNDDVRNSDISSLRSAIIAECLKDERVNDVDCDITFLSGTLHASILLHLNPGPFALTLSISSVTVEILSIGL